MGKLDGMDQVEKLCIPSEKQNLTPLNDRVDNSRSDFDKKLKDVTSWIPGKGVNASKLETTLDSTLKGLLPQIREDAKSGCLAAADTIKEAKGSLSTQQLVDSYVLANKVNPGEPKRSTAGLGTYGSGMNLDKRMKDAGL